MRLSAILLLLPLLLAAPLVSAHGAEYPSQAIMLTVPYAPGGMTDLSARAFAPALAKALGQNVVVVNKPGGSGIVGTLEVVKSAPGYNLVMIPQVVALPEIFRPDATAYSSKDMVPVGRVVINVNTIVVSNDIPVTNIAELVAYVKANPGTRYAHGGRGNATHLLGAALMKATGMELKDVPYEGDAAIATAVLGDQVKVGIASLPGVLGNVKAGKMRAIAVYLPERTPELPDVATLAEQGITVSMPLAFNGLFSPVGITEEQLAVLEKAMEKAFADPELSATLVKVGGHPGYLSRSAFLKELDNYREASKEFVSFFQ